MNIIIAAATALAAKEAELDDAKAREAKLREALEGIAKHPLADKPSDLAGWREFSKMLRRIARAALGETQ